MAHDKTVLTMSERQEVVRGLLNGTAFNDLERP